MTTTTTTHRTLRHSGEIRDFLAEVDRNVADGLDEPRVVVQLDPMFFPGDRRREVSEPIFGRIVWWSDDLAAFTVNDVERGDVDIKVGKVEAVHVFGVRS